MLHPYNGFYYAIKRNELLLPQHIDKSQNSYVEWKKSDSPTLKKVGTIWIHLHKILENKNSN